MDDSLNSLLGTPHFTPEIQDYLLLKAKDKNYKFYRSIPHDMIFECFNISHISKKEDLKIFSENFIVDSFIKIFEEPLGFFMKRRFLNRIFENLDIYTLYLWSTERSSSPIYRDSIGNNENFFEGQPLSLKESNLTESLSFKLCNERFFKTKDLMFLIIFCMKIKDLENFQKNNSSYFDFINKVIELKNKEKESVFNV